MDYIYFGGSNVTNVKYRGPILRVTWSELAQFVLRTFEKSLRAAEKNKEKVEANCTGFSADFFGTQSVEMPGK